MPRDRHGSLHLHSQQAITKVDKLRSKAHTDATRRTAKQMHQLAKVLKKVHKLWLLHRDVTVVLPKLIH